MSWGHKRRLSELIYWMMENSMFLHVKIVEGGQAPERRSDSAGWDCFSRIAGSLDPMIFQKIPLGFSSEFSSDLVGLLFDRSSCGIRGVTRFAGVIDSSYRDEWAAILYNASSSTWTFGIGQRIIQCVFVPFVAPILTIVDSLSESSRKGGFGTTERLANYGFQGPDTSEVREWLEHMEKHDLPEKVPEALKPL